MRRLSTLALAALVAACAPPAEAPPFPEEGGADGGGDGGGASTVVRGAFDASLALSYEGDLEAGPPQEWPRQLRLKIAFAQLEAGRAQVVVASSQGGSVARDDQATFEPPQVISQASLSLALQDLPCEDGVFLQLQSLAFEAVDRDRDGRPDELEGTATGTLSQFSGDVAFVEAFEAHVDGPFDPSPPALSPDVPDALAPLDAVPLVFDETVRLGPSVTLTAGDREIPARVVPVGSPTQRASVVPLEPLPWGAEVVASGLVAVDLLGQASDDELLVKTAVRERPPGFPQPSFEGGTFVGYDVDGDVRLYDAASGLAADDGRFFVLADNRGPWRIVFERALPSDATELVLTARQLGASAGAVVQGLGVRLTARSGLDEAEGVLELPREGASLAGPTQIDLAEGPATWATAKAELKLDVRALAGRSAVIEVAPVNAQLGCGGRGFVQLGGVMLDGLAVR